MPALFFSFIFALLFLAFAPSQAMAITTTPTPYIMKTKTIETSLFSPPSPDPSGITFIKSLNKFLVVDSEVDEMTIFTGKNIFEVSLDGQLTNSFSTSAFSNEPTGISYDPATNQYFISDDVQKKIFKINPGADANLGTADDQISSFPTSAFGCTDPEGLFVYENKILIAGGIDKKVFQTDFSGNLIKTIDVGPFGIIDFEGVTVNPDSGHLFMLSRNPKALYETDSSGNLLRKYGINVLQSTSPADLVYAPSSSTADNPSNMDIYIVDRMIDNNTNPNENDGRIYELFIYPRSAMITNTPSISPSILKGDANFDGKVDGVDYVIWLINYNKSITQGAAGGDFDGNGFVDGLDYVIWLQNYNKTGTSETPTPTLPFTGSDYQKLLNSLSVIRAQTVWPVPGYGLEYIESAFGPRIKVSTNAYDFHRGIDIDAPLNTPVIAPLDGELWDVVTYPSGGLTVLLRHSLPQPIQYAGITLDYYYTFYMHLNSASASLVAAASQGQHPVVKKGTEIGKVGHSGGAVGDHLHWELRVGTWCSLEFQIANPSSSCSGFNFDPAMNSLLLYPPFSPGNMKLTLVTTPSATGDGKLNYTSSPNAPLLNRIEYKIIDASSGTVVKSHLLDLNQRIGFDARTTFAIDTPDKSKPYISPVSFGVSKDPYETNIIIPAVFIGNLSGANYKYTLTVTDIWETTTVLNW